MKFFLELEGGYLIIGVFLLLIALFVGTREFIGDGKTWKKTVPITLIVLVSFIGMHFYITIDRMNDVKEQFLKGDAIICESKAVRKVAQSIIIDPQRPQGWILIGDEFVSPQFQRSFHSARCIKYYRKPLKLD